MEHRVPTRSWCVTILACAKDSVRDERQVRNSLGKRVAYVLEPVNKCWKRGTLRVERKVGEVKVCSCAYVWIVLQAFVIACSLKGCVWTRGAGMCIGEDAEI